MPDDLFRIKIFVYYYQLMKLETYVEIHTVNPLL